MARLSLQQVALLALLGAIICSSNIFQFGDAQDSGEIVQRENCTNNGGTCRLCCGEGETRRGRCGLSVCCYNATMPPPTSTPAPARG